MLQWGPSLLFFSYGILFTIGCTSFQKPYKSFSETPNILLNSVAEHDFYVLRSDIYSMKGHWLKAQMDLERALEIKSHPKLQVRHALILAHRGQYNVAEKNLFKILKHSKNKKNIEAQLVYGEILALQNKSQKSIEAYKEVLKHDPKNYKAIVFLGAIYSQLDKTKTAKFYFKKLRQVEEQKHLAGYYLGRLRQQEKKFSNSERFFKECLNFKPDFTACIFSLVDSLSYQKKIKEAIHKVRHFIELNPNSDRAYTKLYDLYIENEDFSKAFQQLVQLERFEPRNRHIKMQIALHLIEKQDLDKALLKLNDILSLSPKFGQAYYLISNIYTQKGNFKKSYSYFLKIPKNQPIYIEASIQRAREIENSKGSKSALRFLKTVKSPKHDVRTPLYIALLQSQLGHIKKSIHILRQVVKNNMKNTQILYYLGHLEGETGQWIPAISRMKQVVQLDPNHSDALNYIAYYYANNKIQLEEAYKMSKKSLLIKPNESHYLDTLGWICFQMGRYKEAQAYLEEAYELHPKEAIIAEHLAMVYSKNGLLDKARQIYLTLIKRGIGDKKKIQRQINSIFEEKKEISLGEK